MKTLYKKYFVFNYIIVVSILSIILFFYGFFPLSYITNDIASMEDIPKFIDSTRINTDEAYKPVLDKVVIMVIDAFRWDYVFGINNSEYMPITENLLQVKAGCIYKTKVDPPTVTMPRIKALTTGSVPNFIDVILNLGAHQLMSDNILRQFKNRGHKIIFYGDDTWLKLFPYMFYRSEGTTSFNVNDFTEVDNNVTKNLVIELQENDWTVMILHYLGLDRIGHLSDPDEHLIKPKLREMDQIIGAIESYVFKWNEKNISTLFLVSGDHGMRNFGGHGGASLEETLVPLIAFGRSCTEGTYLHSEISQTDIGITLSVLLGTPIPLTNIGNVIVNLLSGLSVSKKLFALYYNAKQILRHFQKINGYQNTVTYNNYEYTKKLHTSWLNTKSYTNETGNDIIVMYESVIMEMKNIIKSNMAKYDITAMTVATILMAQILFINISVEKSTVTSYKQFFIACIVTSITWIFLNQLIISNTKITVFSQKPNTMFLCVIILVIGLIISSSYLCANRTLPFHKLKEFSGLELLLICGTIAHTLSLSSSSFIEEEHQTWYFFWITLIIFFMYDILRRSANTKSSMRIFFILFIMINHRILIKVNSTGNKNRNIPCISKWLQNSNRGLTIILICGLLLLIGIDFVNEDSENRLVVCLLDVIISVLIYFKHTMSGAVYKPQFHIHSQEKFDIKYLWILASIYLFYSICRLVNAVCTRKSNISSLLLFLVIKKWIIISCILHRPHNVILLPLQLIISATIHDLHKFFNGIDIDLYLYLWSSNAFYFYQGNSNSLATIDVAAGFVGIQSYQPLITGIFLSINTFSANILGILTYLFSQTIGHYSSTLEDTLLMCQKYAFWRLVPMAFYTIITTIHRYHLFIWSVFCPKILYEAMHCFVLFSVIFILQLILIILICMKIIKKI